MRFELSWDDGSVYDQELATLLRKYKLPSTFYIPGCCTLDELEIQNLARDFDIGGHTETHPHDLKFRDDWRLAWELGANKLWLESIIKRTVTKFCYPRGRFDQRVVEAVKKAGFLEARTTRLGALDLPTNPFEMETTVQVYPRPEYKAGWLQEAKDKLDEAIAKDGYFHLWGHSHEIDRFGFWGAVENFFAYASQKIVK